jgi:hypothetical protein
LFNHLRSSERHTPATNEIWPDPIPLSASSIAHSTADPLYLLSPRALNGAKGFLKHFVWTIGAIALYSSIGCSESGIAHLAHLGGVTVFPRK